MRETYAEVLVRLVREGKVPRGAVTSVEVRHDDCCAIYRGGACTCRFEVWTGGRSIWFKTRRVISEIVGNQEIRKRRNS